MEQRNQLESLEANRHFLKHPLEIPPLLRTEMMNACRDYATPGVTTTHQLWSTKHEINTIYGRTSLVATLLAIPLFLKIFIIIF